MCVKLKGNCENALQFFCCQEYGMRWGSLRYERLTFLLYLWEIKYSHLEKYGVKCVITGPGLYIIQHGNIKCILWKSITCPFYCLSLFCSLTSLFYGEQSEKEKTPSDSSPSDSETKATVRKKASHMFKKRLIRIFAWIY